MCHRSSKRLIRLSLCRPAEARSRSAFGPNIELDLNGDTHTVELTEALGGVSYAYVVSDNGEKMIVEERGDARSDEGQRVGVNFETSRVMVFDGNTEARIR